MKIHCGGFMERYMLHLKNSNYLPKDAPELLRKARSLASDIKATVRDTRVSTKYLEYDVSTEKKDLEDLVSNLSPIGILDHAKHVTEEDIEKEQAIKDGISYFNDERFWECHEVLEGVWKSCQEGEKDLVQGIILVAAGLVHFQKNEDSVCLSIFNRALEKLSNAEGIYHEIDINKLCSQIDYMRKSEKISVFKI